MIAALFSRRSGALPAFKIASAHERTWSSEVTSTTAKSFGFPNFLFNASISGRDRPQPITMCPQRMNSSAIARPRPRVTPVMRTVLGSIACIIGLFNHRLSLKTGISSYQFTNSPGLSLVSASTFTCKPRGIFVKQKHVFP